MGHISLAYADDVNLLVDNIDAIKKTGQMWLSWLRHYATSRKFTDSIHDEVTDFFQFTRSIQLHYGPGVNLACNRKEYLVTSYGVKWGWRARLTTLQPSVSQLSRKCGIVNISQPYRPPQPFSGIARIQKL
jgi:hypothetical protein